MPPGGPHRGWPHETSTRASASFAYRCRAHAPGSRDDWSVVLVAQVRQKLGFAFAALVPDGLGKTLPAVRPAGWSGPSRMAAAMAERASVSAVAGFPLARSASAALALVSSRLVSAAVSRWPLSHPSRADRCGSSSGTGDSGRVIVRSFMSGHTCCRADNSPQQPASHRSDGNRAIHGLVVDGKKAVVPLAHAYIAGVAW